MASPAPAPQTGKRWRTTDPQPQQRPPGPALRHPTARPPRPVQRPDPAQRSASRHRQLVRPAPAPDPLAGRPFWPGHAGQNHLDAGIQLPPAYTQNRTNVTDSDLDGPPPNASSTTTPSPPTTGSSTPALVVLYGQPLSRIARLTTNDIRTTQRRRQLSLDGHPTFHEPFAGLIQQLPQRRSNGVAGQEIESTWLFPGSAAGSHIGPSALQDRLAALDIQPLHAQHRPRPTRQRDPARRPRPAHPPSAPRRQATGPPSPTATGAHRRPTTPPPAQQLTQPHGPEIRDHPRRIPDPFRHFRYANIPSSVPVEAVRNRNQDAHLPRTPPATPPPASWPCTSPGSPGGLPRPPPPGRCTQAGRLVAIALPPTLEELDLGQQVRDLDVVSAGGAEVLDLAQQILQDQRHVGQMVLEVHEVVTGLFHGRCSFSSSFTFQK